MKIALISPYADVQSFGVRILAACLRRAGHEPRLFFLWKPTVTGRSAGGRDGDEYSEPAVDELVRLCADTQLVGISLMTEHVFRARFLTRKLKERLSAPVIWGGVHPTIRPEECLRYADMVCVGEGETALVQLADALGRGASAPEIPGIWRKQGQQMIANGPSPLTEDLDDLPFPDYEGIESFILNKDSVKPLDAGLIEEHLALEPYDLAGGVTFGVVSSRGCPFNCTFCATNYFRGLYRKDYHVRLHGVDHVLEELVQARRRFPYITGIRFHDDTFVAREEEELSYFRDRYRREVGLPFACYAHPVEVTEEKIKLLCEAGMAKLGVGIQTGSRRLQQLYHRRVPNEKILAAARIIRKFQPPLQPPWYDMIIDYYNQQEADAIETFDLLQRLPKPHSLHVFSMVLWPGTALYERARQEEIIGGDDDEVYRSSYNVHAIDYLTLVYQCYKHAELVPAWLARFLSRPAVVRVLNRAALRPLFAGLFGAERSLKALLNKARGRR